MPAPRPVETDYHDGGATVFWNCPSMFIPPSVYSWFHAYKFHKDFPGCQMKPLNEISTKFFQAVNVYEAALAEQTKVP